MEHYAEDKLIQLLNRETKAKIICAQLNNFTDLKPTLMAVIDHIKDLTNCEALSIRLHEDGDYPYYVYNGFPESFIKKENRLCSNDDNGNRIPSPDGKGYLLDCMCGNIIRGRFDPALPFFSKKGSFWSNNTTVLLASTNEEERQSNTRNYCNSCGYESVALIPIRIEGERIGLIQLNDKRTGMFNEDLIEFIEMIAGQIGFAVRNSFVHTKLKEAYAEINKLRGILPICSYCKKIRDDKGYWTQLESYFHEHSETKFSHGICPECAEKYYPDMDLYDEDELKDNYPI